MAMAAEPDGTYLEDWLDRPVSDLLPVMQEAILQRSQYFGVRTWKSPLDAWMYQELLVELRPDVVLEIGTAFGGSALMLAHVCDALGHGRVVSVDISHDHVPDIVRDHPRVLLVTADAVADADRVLAAIAPGERVLIIEDSSHTYENTLGVLEAYTPLLGPGDYIVVEDGICHHGLDVGPHPGPWEAIDAFLAVRPDFESDRSRERYVITWNPKGYLRRRP